MAIWPEASLALGQQIVVLATYDTKSRAVKIISSALFIRRFLML
jgi:hypothetical protein